jgi:hypothetical protein
MGFFDKVMSTAQDAIDSVGNAIDNEKQDMKIRDEKRNVDKAYKEIGEIVVRCMLNGEDYLPLIREPYNRALDGRRKITSLMAEKDKVDPSDPYVLIDDVPDMEESAPVYEEPEPAPALETPEPAALPEPEPEPVAEPEPEAQAEPEYVEIEQEPYEAPEPAPAAEVQSEPVDYGGPIYIEPIREPRPEPVAEPEVQAEPGPEPVQQPPAQQPKPAQPQEPADDSPLNRIQSYTSNKYREN